MYHLKNLNKNVLVSCVTIRPFTEAVLNPLTLTTVNFSPYDNNLFRQIKEKTLIAHAARIFIFQSLQFSLQCPLFGQTIMIDTRYRSSQHHSG